MIDRAASRPWVAFAWVALLVAVVVALTPYLWIVLASFKTRVDLFSSVPKWFFSPTLANYPAVFIGKGYLAAGDQLAGHLVVLDRAAAF